MGVVGCCSKTRSWVLELLVLFPFNEIMFSARVSCRIRYRQQFTI
jgi:hypothetical protein